VFESQKNLLARSHWKGRKKRSAKKTPKGGRDREKEGGQSKKEKEKYPNLPPVPEKKKTGISLTEEKKGHHYRKKEPVPRGGSGGKESCARKTIKIR